MASSSRSHRVTRPRTSGSPNQRSARPGGGGGDVALGGGAAELGLRAARGGPAEELLLEAGAEVELPAGAAGDLQGEGALLAGGGRVVADHRAAALEAAD